MQKRVSLKVAEGEENLNLEDISRLPFCLSFRGTLKEEKGRRKLVFERFLSDSLCISEVLNMYVLQEKEKLVT